MVEINSSSKKWHVWIYYLCLAGLLYFPVFNHLGHLSIRIWDESRLANNAYEMYQTHRWLVTTYDYQPDLWNTKPPLMIWLQVLCLYVFGVNELALRMPSALAAMALCFYLLRFSKVYFGEYFFGFLASLVLVSFPGYINEHVTRTGDYDSLLVCFLTIHLLSFFLYCHEAKLKYLYGSMVCLGLAVLTKGVGGLLMLPVLFFYLLWRNKLKQMFTFHFCFAASLGILIFLSYYLIREYLCPGYLACVYQNELGGRYLAVLEGNEGGFWLYLDFLYTSYLGAWLWWIPFALISVWTLPDGKGRQFMKFSILVIVIYYIVIGSSETKLRWYVAPMYPFFAFIIAAIVPTMKNVFQGRLVDLNSARLRCFATVLCLMVVLSPYLEISKKMIHSQEDTWAQDYYRIANYMKAILAHHRKPLICKILNEGYCADLHFYSKLLYARGCQMQLSSLDQVNSGDLVMAAEAKMRSDIEKHFEYKIYETDYNLFVYEITGKKD